MHRATTVIYTIADLNECWFTLRIRAKECVTIGDGMQPTRKISSYLSAVVLRFIAVTSNLGVL